MIDNFELMQIQWEYKQYEDFIKQVTSTMKDVDPLTKYCMYTTDEYLDASEDYGFVINDMTRLVYNVIYRFGEIYDISLPVYPYLDQTVEYP